MKVTLESTTKIIELKTETGAVSARIWQGETESGIQVHAFITRMVVEDGDNSVALAIFEKELKACVPPRLAVQTYDMRYFLD